MILAEKIITLRKKNGWSQEELAEKMNVSRQSVSKWEGAQSVPDLNKILMLSEIFGVSTDYLLKDELEIEEYVETKPEIILEQSVRRVTMEEAIEFLDIQKQNAERIAIGVFMCIVSPICLMLLGGAAEMGYIPLSEDAAGTFGVILLLLLIAGAVAIFITCGMKSSGFEYQEKEAIETAYGVDGMVKERQKQFQPFFIKNVIIGVSLCILAVVPLLAATMITENAFVIVCMVCILLAMIGCGVIFFIRGGIPWDSMQKLLQEGDYTVEKKKKSALTGAVAGIYWLLMTAGYLAYSFYTNNWSRSWIIWPVAGVLYGAIQIGIDSFGKK